MWKCAASGIRHRRPGWTGSSVACAPRRGRNCRPRGARACSRDPLSRVIRRRCGDAGRPALPDGPKRLPSAAGSDSTFRFTSYRNHVPSVMCMMKVVIHASIEPFGVVPLKGMAHGKALIGSTTGGPFEGETGLAFPRRCAGVGRLHAPTVRGPRLGPPSGGRWVCTPAQTLLRFHPHVKTFTRPTRGARATAAYRHRTHTATGFGEDCGLMGRPGATCSLARVLPSDRHNIT